MNRTKVNTVSIITPCLNSESTIRKTIESVLRQSYHNIEYIIIDGNSTDKTVNIIEEYAPLFEKRLQYISEKDDGIYDAMNKGIRMAKGDVIGIINSDDWYEDDAVEQVMKCFNDKLADVVYGRIYQVDEEGKRTNYVHRELETIWYQMAIPHPSTFVRKVVYQGLGMFNTKFSISADYELMLRLYSSGVRFEYINKYLANFRIGGISQQSENLAWKELYEAAFLYIERCKQYDKFFSILKENYEYFLLETLLEKEPYKFQDMLNSFWKEKIQEIIIFGIGNWGEKCYKALKQTDIMVRCFLDNGNRLNEKHGKVVCRPESVQVRNVHILIAVRHHADDIRKQLQELHADSIASISELVQAYLSYSELMQR